MIPVKIEVTKSEGRDILYAENLDGIIVGRLEYATVKSNMIRVIGLEVLEDYRRGKVATILIDALTSQISGLDDDHIITIWYDDEDVSNGFDEFIKSTNLFDVSDEMINGRVVHIAVWNGHTFEEQYIEE